MGVLRTTGNNLLTTGLNEESVLASPAKFLYQGVFVLLCLWLFGALVNLIHIIVMGDTPEVLKTAAKS